MKNAPTEEKKKEEKGLERESFTRESLSKFRRISRDAAFLFTDCWPEERERRPSKFDRPRKQHNR